jgi:hypothetical protein
LNAPRHLRLITRHACELCEELLALLEPYAASGVIQLDALDVDAEPALHAAHTWRVPVLMEGDQELMWGKIEVAEVVAALGQPLSGPKQHISA